MGLLDGIKRAIAPVTTKLTEAAQAVAAKAEQVKAPPTGHSPRSTFDASMGSATASLTGARSTVPVLEARLGPAIHKAFDRMQLKMADGLMKEGKYDEARAIVQKLKDGPRAGDELQPWGNGWLSGELSTQRGSDKKITFSHPSTFQETLGTAASRKLEQIDQAERMTKALGRTADPTNVHDAKAYFDAISSKRATPMKSTVEVGQEFERYTRNFYQHPGGLTWDPRDPVAERVKPGTLNEMLHGSPAHARDVTGRAALDCEGYTYLTAALFQNNPRFDVAFASSSSHISAGVFEKGSRDTGFIVDSTHEPIVHPLEVDPKVITLHKQSKTTAEWSQLELVKANHGQRRDNGTYPGAPRGSRDITQVNAAEHPL
ncbi:MAG: hypothetical protein Q8S33_14540 [Myxococcales bacterium]|nr:hypothetical protein [Myxococcales bacterium]